jgi:hypothetical protein
LDRDVKEPMRGLRVWENPKNKFTIVEIHYTADPHKRTEKWINEIKPRMPIRKWNQEYELSWETWFGLPVYPDFSEPRHGVLGAIDPHIGLPLLRGWDFGLTPAAVIAQLQGETLCVMKEFIGLNMGAKRFSKFVTEQCAILFPGWPDRKRDWIDVCDPAGFARNQNDETTCAQELMNHGLAPKPGLIAFEARRKGVEDYLTFHGHEGAGFQISLSGCPVLVRGFKGGYQYPENSLESQAAKITPLKNEYSHPHDALQYVAGIIKQLTRRAKTTIARPGYGFSTR